MMFIVSIWLRLRQYADVLAIVRKAPDRWPKLLDLIKAHKSLLITWSTTGSLVLVLLLWGIQILASRFVWPEAGKPPLGLTIGRLWDHPILLTPVAVFGLAMLACDIYCTFVVGEMNRPDTEKYLDQAEFWLKSWTAPVIRVFTLGFINPRRMVAVELKKALKEASRVINFNLWWIVTQTGLRIAYGLAVWIAYGLSLDHV